MTKVKLNRLDHYIPMPDYDGLLYVDDLEEKMVFKSLGELNAKFGRDNITSGFNVTYNQLENKFIISSGQTTIYKRLGYTYDNQGLHIHFPLWGVNGVYKFEEQDIINVDEDDSEIDYINPEMTTDTKPYGKCSETSTKSSGGTGNVYNMFNSSSNEFKDSFATEGAQFYIDYMFDENGRKQVKPTSIYIRNGSSGISSTNYEFEIYGTIYKHPYDTKDWTLIKNISTQHSLDADTSTVHVLNIDNYYRGIRLLLKTSSYSFRQIQISGITKDSFGNNEKSNYFICHIIKNGKEQNIVASSYNDTPTFENAILVDFIPLVSNEYYVDDFDGQVYYETNSNSQYVPDLSKEGEMSVVLSPDGIHSRLLFNYTVENGQIVNYYPKIDLATAYVNRFVIDEQQGAMGYKIYNDGWKIQWGNQSNPTFPVAFEKAPMVVIPTTATNVTNLGMNCSTDWLVKGY